MPDNVISTANMDWVSSCGGIWELLVRFSDKKKLRISNTNTSIRSINRVRARSRLVGHQHIKSAMKEAVVYKDISVEIVDSPVPTGSG